MSFLAAAASFLCHLLAQSSPGATTTTTAVSGLFDVTAYGARGDGRSLDTAAVRRAAAALKRAGGGELRFPAGYTFLTAPFNLSSHTLLTIGAGTTIRASNVSGVGWPLLTVSEIWPWFGQSRDAPPGSEAARLMHNPIIFAWRAQNISIVAGEGGTLDGGGQAWWNCWRNLSAAPCSGYSRPQNLFFSNVSGVRIVNLTTLNPPDWNVHLGWCEDVHVTGLSAHSLASTATHPYANAPNADGIDIDACQRVLVEDSFFSVTDDAICIKSGLDWFGRKFGRPTRDVLVRRCEIAAGAGPTIGSEMSGGVFNVTFEDITLGAEELGVTLKTARGRGGVVSDIVYRRIKGRNVGGAAVQLNTGYHGQPGHHSPPNATNKTGTPILKNILFEDCDFITGDLGYAATMSGLKEAPVLNVTFKNVNFYPPGKNPDWPHKRPKPGYHNSSTMWGPCEYVVGVCEGGTSLESCPPCFKMSPTTRQTDWLVKRAKFVDSVFGPSAQGKLPTRSLPDVGPMAIPGPQVHASNCARYGFCDARAAAYGNNMSTFRWRMAARVNASYVINITSTVFYTLNTSGVAPQTYPDSNGPPHLPGGGWYGNASLNTPALYPGGGNNDKKHYPDIPPTPARSDTLVLWHHGHSQPCDSSGCHVPWIDDQLDWLNELGLDAMVLQMPGYQCNYDQPAAGWVPGNKTGQASHWGGGCNHSWWKELEKQGVSTGRYFVEPVILTINYAKKVLGYKRIIMMGLSGGGWTTTMAAALDPRIELSIPVAGSIPCSFDHTSIDFEQFCERPYNQVCDYECQYVLASLEASRYSVQIIHEFDPCCFHGHGRHEKVKEYNAFVQMQARGHFETCITMGHIHEFNLRDKTVAAILIDNLRVHGVLTNSTGLYHLPFNTLHQW